MTSGAVAGPGSESPDRRAALVASRLAAVAASAGLSDVVPLEPGHPRGAAVRGISAGRDRWWVNPAGDRPHLGAVLAWSTARGDWSRQPITLVSDDVRSASIDARRAALFDVEVEVRGLADGTTGPVEAALHAPVPVACDEHLAFADVIASAGADVVIENGVVTGEVFGLEVCRVVDSPSTGPTLAVGVGEHDRETFALVHGHRPVEDSLASTVAHVATHRAPGATPHPINRIAHERLLRSRAIADPDLVRASQLVPAEPPIPRTNLKDAVPCLAAREDGSLVCFVSGVDLEALPFLLDAVDRSSTVPPHRASAPSRPPALVLRSRDLVASVARIALLATVPVEIIILPDEIG